MVAEVRPEPTASEMLEDISAEILSVSTADGMAEIGSKEQRTKFPVFPDEKPSATQLKQWLDCWTDDLNASGYAALLRGEETFELKKLMTSTRSASSTCTAGRPRCSASMTSSRARTG